MEIFCSRPGCAKPRNQFPELDSTTIKNTAMGQLFCQNCGMPLILDGRYVPEKPLAKGGFSITYLARDRRTPKLKRCVVKQLILQGFDAEQTRLAKQLFEREGAVLEELGNHPQIPDLLAFFELDVDGENFFYLVQEYIDGITLERLVKDLAPLSSHDVIEVLHKLLPVLQFVHDRNAVHRDIKPANIMVHRTTQVYYLLDFGAVKQIQSITSPHSSRSTCIFTPGFAAPEQMKGGTIYPATDIYGLGATCIFLLTGKDPDELNDPHTNEVNWRQYAPNVNAILADIIDRMTAPSLEKRYGSADAVLADLENLVAELPQAEPVNTVAPPEVDLEVSFKPAVGAQVEVVPPKEQVREVLAGKFAQSINQIPLQSYILSGFGFGFQLGLWGVLALTQGFRLMGVIPSLLLLLGILLGLLFLRGQNILDNKDMLASPVVSFVFVLILKALFRSGFAQPAIADLLAVSLVVGFGTVAALLMFRLFNQTLRQFL